MVLRRKCIGMPCIRKLFFSYLSIFLVTILFSEMIFAATKTSTYFSEFRVASISTTSLNISATLSSFVLPESKQTLAEYAQTGQIDPSVISSNYGLSPVAGQSVVAYLVDPNDQSNQVKLCNWITNSEGKGFCIATVSSNEAVIKVRFEGDSTFFPTQRFETVFSSSVFSFKELVDSSWFIVFLFIGVLAAALYASGRKPMSAFDITMPKVKGIKVPRVTKLSLKTSTSVMKGTMAKVFTSVAVAFYKAKNVDLNSLSAVNTLEKYTPRNKYAELMEVYTSRSEQDRMLKLARRLNQFGVRSKLMKGLATSKSRVNTLQKRKEKLEKIKAKARTEGEIWRANQAEKKINEMMQQYVKKIQEYEKDLKALSALTLAKKAELESINPEIIKEELKSVDTYILSEYVQYIRDPGRALNPNFFQDLREQVGLKVTKDFSEHPEIAKKIDAVVQTKIELERIYIAEMIKSLNMINKNVLDIMGDPQNSKHYKNAMNAITPEKERVDSIAAILNDLTLNEFDKRKLAVKNDGVQKLEKGELDPLLTKIVSKQDSLVKNSEYKELLNKLNVSEKLGISNNMLDQYVSEKDGKLKAEIEKEILGSKEKREAVVSLLVGLEKQEGKIFQERMDNIISARNNLEASVDKFLHDVEKYNSSYDVKTKEQSAFNSLISFDILTNKANSFLADIYNRTEDYYGDKPVLDETTARQMFDATILRKDEDQVFELLFNRLMSPYAKDEEVKFALERIDLVENKDIGRTVFDKTFSEMLAGNIDPVEEDFTLDTRLMQRYSLNDLLIKMEREQIVLSASPKSEYRDKALTYAKEFIRKYSPPKLGYEKKE